MSQFRNGTPEEAFEQLPILVQVLYELDRPSELNAAR
jgi:hypothetical protein